MTAWALMHPWMAFLLALVALAVIDSAIANICRVVIEWRKGGAK